MPTRGLGAITRRMDGLRRKVAAHSSPSGTQREELVSELLPVVEELTERVTFLRTQIQTAKLSYSVLYEDPPAGNILYTFNPLYDVSMDVTAGESGILSVTISGEVSGNYSTYGRYTFRVDDELLDDTSNFIVTGISPIRGSSSRTVLVDVEPHKTVTIQTRRIIISTGVGRVYFAYPSLVVTRLI